MTPSALPIVRSLTHRQEEILDIIRHYVHTKGYPPSIREIAADLGVSSISTVHCHLLNLEKKGYIRKDPSRRRSIELLPGGEPSNREVLFLPLLDAETLSAPPDEDGDVLDVFPLSLDFVGQADAFLVQVEGESMRDAGILHGDLVVAHRQTRADDGDIVVAILADEVLVQRFCRAPDGTVRLQPENARMRPILVRDPRIVGKVVGVIRKLV